MDDLQVENGNFTRIINPLIEQLIKIPFKGCELAVAFYIIRKTYGFNKKQDEIPLTQFQKDLERSRQTVVTALKNLELVNILRLVQRGNTAHGSNIWAINKYFDTWKLVKVSRLVKRKGGTSLTELKKLVKRPRHSKDISKESQKTRADEPPEVNELLGFFKENINPHINFGNKTERKACIDLLKTYGLDRIKKSLAFLEEKRKTDKYLPVITTPYELWTKWAKIKQHLTIKKPKIWKSTTSVSPLFQPAVKLN